MLFQEEFIFLQPRSGLVGQEDPKDQVGNLKTQMQENSSIPKTKEGSQKVAWEDPFPTRTFSAIPRDRDRRKRERQGCSTQLCAASSQHYCTLEYFKCCENVVDPWKSTEWKRMLKHPKPMCTVFAFCFLDFTLLTCPIINVLRCPQYPGIKLSDTSHFL